jgi:hypothetical protein
MPPLSEIMLVVALGTVAVAISSFAADIADGMSPPKQFIVIEESR